MDRFYPKPTYVPPGYKPKNVPKKEIDSTGDPTPGNFFLMILFSVFKKFVFAPTHIKIGIYMSALIVCSLFNDFNIVNRSMYLAQKSNFVNIYFVKLGWFWTLVVCTPFVLMTSIVYTGFNKVFIRNNLARLAVATFMWFLFTTVFERIDANTGSCLNPSIKTKLACKQGDHEWLNGFDISGHTFLLMHSLFMILEEVKVFNKWEELRRKLNELAKNKELTPSTEKAYYWFNLLTPYIKVNFFMMAVLSLLWEIMLLSTFLYFHTIMHKLVAASCAIIVWFATYRLWYSNRENFMSPGMPGNGIEKMAL